MSSDERCSRLVHALKGALLRLASENRKISERMLYVIADYDNLRKRAERDAMEMADRASSEVIYAIIEALDDLYAMKSHLDSAGRAQDSEGIALIIRKLNSRLASLGVTEVDPKGQQFNPMLHAALLVEPVEKERDGVVIEVLRKGYMRNGKLIRPAEVKVGRFKGDV